MLLLQLQHIPFHNLVLYFLQLFVAYLPGYIYLNITQKQSFIFNLYLSKPVMYSTSKRIIALILLSSQLLTTTSCSGNFNIPTDTEPQIAHKYQQVDNKRSQDNALVPLTSGLGLDEQEKEDAPDPFLTNQLPLVESNSGGSPVESIYSTVPIPIPADKVLTLSSSKSSKQYKDQSLVSSQAKTVTTPVYIARPTSHSRKPTRDKAIENKHFTFNKSKDLDAYREQARVKRKQARELDNIAFTLTPVLEPTIIEHSLIAKGGHQIQLKKQDDA